MDTTDNTLERPLPKSYMPEAEKEGLSQNLIYCGEASAAAAVGDEEAAWAWMAMAKIPEYATRTLIDFFGKEFTKEKGFSI
ncbi:hypothetical protein AGMMS49960_11210 [Betaproteobacteria bacterium]|nr:hypothetical protein AGMMS49543_08900 [Betaproteobacteria bacterium]GHU01284.1 hypothetical protein AGMMS49960_11210 [Betaproteobacteria bacterium]GHU17253.1 hypothetical protein AGMMS50243_05160 [Betaproteobacteria bacterium]